MMSPTSIPVEAGCVVVTGAVVGGGAEKLLAHDRRSDTMIMKKKRNTMTPTIMAPFATPGGRLSRSWCCLFITFS
jgi:hypothetical protein